ncbi:MAG: hypothetical protein CMH49_08780, partial [Myxococcales bacterium]|nr:hypothetical protein [Myxococcales bacterium]
MYGRLFNVSISVSDLAQHMDAIIYGHFEPTQEIALLCDLSQTLDSDHLQMLSASRHTKHISSALGICLKAKHLSQLSKKRPFFLLSYTHYLEQIKNYYIQEEAYVLLLINEAQRTSESLIGQLLRFIDQQQTVQEEQFLAVNEIDESSGSNPESLLAQTFEHPKPQM